MAALIVITVGTFLFIAAAIGVLLILGWFALYALYAIWKALFANLFK